MRRAGPRPPDRQREKAGTVDMSSSEALLKEHAVASALPGARDCQPIRVLLAERNPIVASALAEKIAADDRFVLVGATKDGNSVLETASRAQFDVAIVGWRLADMDATELLVRLRECKAAARITIFSAEHNIELVKLAVRLGARGFCFQFEDISVLFNTLAAVADGHICVPSIDLARAARSPLARLTVRERELLLMLAQGWSNRQIAAKEGISENTIKFHLKNLYQKLAVKNRTMAVRVHFAELKHRN